MRSQRSQIYFPVAEAHHPDAQVRWIESHGERLKMWVVPRAGSRALIYFGGNAEDVGREHRGVFAVAFPDRSLFLVNYRGYGGSSGQPAEAAPVRGCTCDLRSRDGRRIPRLRSWGAVWASGVAVFVASERPVERLVLVTAFDSLVNVAREYFRWLPVGRLLRDRYESVRSRVRNVKAPVLMVVAGEDEIMPRARSEALARAFPVGQVRVEIVPRVGHNTLDLSPAYLAAVRGFLAATVADGEEP